jgi:type IV pilus assembly protein PilO
VVILTMHDISLRPAGSRKAAAAGTDRKTVGIGPNIPLELAGTVKTYRYLDEDEAKQQEKNAAPAGKGGR